MVGRAVTEVAKSREVARTAPAICLKIVMVGMLVECEVVMTVDARCKMMVVLVDEVVKMNAMREFCSDLALASAVWSKQRPDGSSFLAQELEIGEVGIISNGSDHPRSSCGCSRVNATLHSTTVVTETMLISFKCISQTATHLLSARNTTAALSSTPTLQQQHPPDAFNISSISPHRHD